MREVGDFAAVVKVLALCGSVVATAKSLRK